MESTLVRNSLALNMGRNASIRRAVNQIEDIVKKHSVGGYAQPQVLPVPDELGPEIPRMIFSSRGGHSQILVSQVGLNFTANYSPDWATDPKRCLDYLLSKVDMLFEIAAAGWEDSPLPAFTGVTTACWIKTNSVAESIRLIAPKFCEANSLVDDANELSYRWSLNVDGKFYDNIAVSTGTQLKAGPSTIVDSIPRFNEKTIEGYGLEIVGDYNDRLAYNNQITFASDATNAKQMIKTSFERTLAIVESFANRE